MRRFPQPGRFRDQLGRELRLELGDAVVDVGQVVAAEVLQVVAATVRAGQLSTTDEQMTAGHFPSVA
jgi:hypothetical protein